MLFRRIVTFEGAEALKWPSRGGSNTLARVGGCNEKSFGTISSRSL